MHWLGRDPNEEVVISPSTETTEGADPGGAADTLVLPPGLETWGATQLADTCESCRPGSEPEPSTPSSGWEPWLKEQGWDHESSSCSSSSDESVDSGVLFIFDWDDTICPTTACSEFADFTDPETATLLDGLARDAADCIAKAKQLGKVVIVTNAGEGWVQASCDRWLPQLSPSLSSVEVISARSTWEPRGVVSPTGWKARTFETLAFGNMDSEKASEEEEVTELWKDIIVVGDAQFEHDALLRISSAAPPDGGYRRLEKCRYKSVRLCPRPSITYMRGQMTVLTQTLEVVVTSNASAEFRISEDTTTPPPAPEFE